MWYSQKRQLIQQTTIVQETTQSHDKGVESSFGKSDGDSINLTLTSPVFYDGYGNVGAQGSWISDSSDGVIAGQKINTTDISCSQSTGFCIEARAYQSDIILRNTLFVQRFDYEIKNWTPKEVVAVLDGGAGTIEIHFDRIKKVVTMTESDKAEIEGASLLPSYAHLGTRMDLTCKVNPKT